MICMYSFTLQRCEGQGLIQNGHYVLCCLLIKFLPPCTVAIDLYSYSVHYYFVVKEDGTARFETNVCLKNYTCHECCLIIFA